MADLVNEVQREARPYGDRHGYSWHPEKGIEQGTTYCCIINNQG